jgi:hypothetical protein
MEQMAEVRFKGGELRVGYRGGEEEAAPIEGGEKRRRPSSIRSRAEEVGRGARRRVAWWHRPKEEAVQHLEGGETPGGPMLC